MAEQVKTPLSISPFPLVNSISADATYRASTSPCQYPSSRGSPKLTHVIEPHSGLFENGSLAPFTRIYPRRLPRCTNFPCDTLLVSFSNGIDIRFDHGTLLRIAWCSRFGTDVIQRRVHLVTQVAELPLSSSHPTSSKPTPRLRALMCFYGRRQAQTKSAVFLDSAPSESLLGGSVYMAISDREYLNSRPRWEVDYIRTYGNTAEKEHTSR